MGVELPSRPEEVASFEVGDSWLRVISEIANRHKFPGDATMAHRLKGSCVVYRVGDAVIKLYEPWNQVHFRVEAEVLAAVYGQLSVLTPNIFHSGEIDGWNYIVMTHLKGVPLGDVWPGLSRDEKSMLLKELGEMCAALHHVPTNELSPELHIDWDAFTQKQADGCVERQRGLGLEERWLRDLPDYVKRLVPLLEHSAPPVLLHTEIMGANVLLEQREDVWRVSGLIDFEPSMIGQAEYEFAAIAVFVTQGDPELFRTFLTSYGKAESELTPNLSARVMAWLLLHRYANVPWYMESIPESKNASTWDELQALWCGMDAVASTS